MSLTDSSTIPMPSTSTSTSASTAVGSSMEKEKEKEWEKYPVYLKNGQQVRVNDHVYCAPSWTIRDGTPYSVARIMEFLRPEVSSDQDEYAYTRVRLAWYYRPSDVSDRPVNDSRLLLAAIYSEVCDINQIRGKCFVIHRDKISDLAGWKKRPDRFYFMRLFDPYIKKEFEVIQSGDVRNVPENVRQTLIERYEYVVAEKEVIPDLTDQIRLCETCEVWCPTPDSVQCDRCKKYFHMRCVQPPLLAKPSRGYGWTCAPCSRRHEEQLDPSTSTAATGTGATTRNSNNAKAAPVTNKSNAPAPRGRGRPRKDRTQAEKEENLVVKHFKMWPFRYFGQFTVAEDTLDPEDLIFPRAATRVGPKYQPVFPEFGSKHMGPDEERGEDKTIEILSALHDFTSAEIAEVEKHLASITPKNSTYRTGLHGVDFLTEAIRQISDASMNGKPLGSVTLKSIEGGRMEKWKTHPTKFYTDPEWTDHEKEVFEEAIAMYGAELRAVRDEIVVKSMPEVVRYYGWWKNMKLGQEHAQLREHGPPPMPSYVKYASASNKSQTIGQSEDDEGSVISAIPPSKPPSCGACRTKESKVWWKAPKGLQSNLLCDTCGTNWRKYADLNVRPVREESVPRKATSSSAENGNGSGKGEKREGTPLAGPAGKRVKTSSSTQSTPPPASNVPQIKCSACAKNGPVGKVLKCSMCGFQCHAASCGATITPSDVDKWQCDLCRNVEAQEASIYHDCLLCPRSHSDKNTRPDSFLRACKPTEGQGWAHVLCSVFIPEVLFTDSGHLKSVEGISTIPISRWTSVKSSRRDSTTTITFQGESGLMSPVIMCKDHDHGKRRLYSICETDEGGESVLQVYCRAYKQASVISTHGLLRKARRLDQILNIPTEATMVAAADSSVDNMECIRCGTQFTPAFYPADDGSGGWVCHCCNFKAPTVAMEVSPPLTPVEELMSGVQATVMEGTDAGLDTTTSTAATT
ncbi:hypothetical protein WG66_012548 [Moniliophthora roreri]|nr:hypothetical protein WG66_012548 [Moniliophthora roreri]